MIKENIEIVKFEKYTQFLKDEGLIGMYFYSKNS